MVDLIASEKEIAQQTVERFVRKFGEPYKLLAYHAALPLLLTPELLNYLRAEFLYGQVPWIAEVDLLLSPLCQQVGHELYAMDTAARAYLLEEMQQAIGATRMQAVARLLLGYVKLLSLHHPFMGAPELESQQWAAMVFLDEHRETAVNEIAEAFQRCAANDGVGTAGQSLINKAEMSRLSNLAQEFAPQLREYPVLLDYAQTVSRVLDDPNADHREKLRSNFEVLPDVHLSIPDSLVIGRSFDLDASLPPNFPSIQEFEFEVATIANDDRFDEQIQSQSEPIIPQIQLVPFKYQVAKIRVTEVKERKGIFGIGEKPKHYKVEIIKTPRQGQQFVEQIREDLNLEMVYVPSGEFVMGAPEREEESRSNERPTHHVTVSAFLMGKYPITQAQYEAVMGINPSHFKGRSDSDRRPVEQVSWDDANEFCKRLSDRTGREYLLPSEAQWEYACRAKPSPPAPLPEGEGSKRSEIIYPPFHFGETISTKVANYYGSVYGRGEKGESRGETTPVDHFGVANEFGLCDMHGNVWEWCLDTWHENYDKAPTDGSARIELNKASHLLRGGSWVSDPLHCRSAYRFNIDHDDRYNHIGFRVLSHAPGLT